MTYYVHDWEGFFEQFQIHPLGRKKEYIQNMSVMLLLPPLDSVLIYIYIFLYRYSAQRGKKKANYLGGGGVGGSLHVDKKHCENREKLPREHLIGC